MLEDGLIFYFSSQGTQCLFYQASSQNLLFYRIHLRVAQRMRNRNRRYDTVSTNSQRDWHNCGDVYDRHNLFDFFDERCTATRASASGGGQNGGGNPRILEMHSNLGTISFGVGYRRSVTNSGVELVVQFANAAFTL